uniref:CMP/dCMP-type deaminase domain-containing protein n=1 Tax=viral metagenome TaxID=1070528 RepID=A0A6C0AEF6_9ZZZZ
MEFIEEVKKLRIIPENRHYAFFVNKGIIFSKGMNSYIKDKTCTTIHAELDALKKVSKLKNCPKNADLIIINVKKNGDLNNGKACEHCLFILKNSKINFKNIYYSNIIEGNVCIVKEKFNKITKNIKSKQSKSLRFKCVNTEYNK